MSTHTSHHRYGKRLFFSAALTFLFPIFSFARGQDAGRTLSLDTGYTTVAENNRSFANLWLELESAVSGVFDLADERTLLGESVFGRLALFAGVQSAWSYPSKNMMVANHELGHGTRILALGYQPLYNGEPSSLSMLPHIFGRPRGGETSTENWPKFAFSFRDGTFPRDWFTNIYAAGMNNSTMFAEELEDEALYNTGHVNTIASYLNAKDDAYDYATSAGTTGDMEFVTEAYEEKGYKITAGDVANGSRTALFGSLTTYAYLWSVVNYLRDGNPNVSPFFIGHWKLPDLSFYLNRNGLSYRLRSSYVEEDRAFPFSIESIYNGTPTIEVSFGFRSLTPFKNIRKTGSLVQIYFNDTGGAGLKAIKDFLVTESSFISLYGSVFSINSLEGERNMGHLKANLGYDASLKWSWIY